MEDDYYVSSDDDYYDEDDDRNNMELLEYVENYESLRPEAPTSKVAIICSFVVNLSTKFDCVIVFYHNFLQFFVSSG